MAHAQQRRALGGPALIRLLARLADIDVPEAGQSLADRLSQWLSWTDAIPLSAALNASPLATTASARSAGADIESMCARVRTALTKAIVSTCTPDGRSSGSARSPGRTALAAPTVDYAEFRQRYVSMQQAMELEIGNLRSHLRRALAVKTPDLAKLAVLDASMEQALSAREHTLLASVPTLLGHDFERLRAAEPQHADIAADGASQPASRAWLDAFRNDMQSVLLAELDIRFQPVEGLLAALRTR